MGGRAQVEYKTNTRRTAESGPQSSCPHITHGNGHVILCRTVHNYCFDLTIAPEPLIVGSFPLSDRKASPREPHAQDAKRTGERNPRVRDSDMVFTRTAYVAPRYVLRPYGTAAFELVLSGLLLVAWLTSAGTPSSCPNEVAGEGGGRGA